jgi:hypothetical protein
LKLFGSHANKWYKMWTWNEIHDCHGNSSTLQEEDDSFHQQIKLN